MANPELSLPPMPTPKTHKSKPCYLIKTPPAVDWPPLLPRTPHTASPRKHVATGNFPMTELPPLQHPSGPHPALNPPLLPPQHYPATPAMRHLPLSFVVAALSRTYTAACPAGLRQRHHSAEYARDVELECVGLLQRSYCRQHQPR